MHCALPAEFYDRPVENVARDLLGKQLCRRSRAGLTIGRIVETEAYLAKGDSASHSFKGMNRRNASMFGPPGRAYVYTIHARQCVNVVTEGRGAASAVLIRAVEPLVGVELMEARRRTDKRRDLCRGPARLCEAFEVGRALDGWDVTQPRRLWLSPGLSDESVPIAVSGRVGVTSAETLSLRFFQSGSVYVSGPKSLNQPGAVQHPAGACVSSPEDVTR